MALLFLLKNVTCKKISKLQHYCESKKVKTKEKLTQTMEMYTYSKFFPCIIGKDFLKPSYSIDNLPTKYWNFIEGLSFIFEVSFNFPSMICSYQLTHIVKYERNYCVLTFAL